MMGIGNGSMSTKTAILCVDDEDMVLSSLKRQLRRHFGNDHYIEVAQDGDEALEIVEEFADNKVDLAVVISDYIMPVMRGDELLQRIHAKLPETINILLTGQANMEGVTNAVNYANLYRYIAKPWDQTDLILTVTEALRSYRQDKMLAEHNETLKRVNRQLEQLNTNLEQQVTERTKELQTAYQNLKRMHASMEDDLLLAREIQQGILPPSRVQWPELDVACYNITASELGGDFYLHHAFGQSHFALMVGDVSGKGVSAALLMASCIAHLDVSLSHELTPTERLEYLDTAISPHTKPRRRNCALSYVEIQALHDATFLAHVVNAGCIPPYVRRKHGTVEWQEVSGFALGQGLGSMNGYEELALKLFPGDVLVMVSDGVLEARNHRGEMFGFERLQQTIADCPVTSAAHMLTHLVFEVTEFMGIADPGDDMTIIVAQIKGR